MSESKEDGHGTWSRVPTRDGSPLTWRAFRREMNWWIAALELEQTRKYDLAARSGAVQARCEEFDFSDFQYKFAVTFTDPDSGEVLVEEAEDLLHGLNKVLQALEAMNGPRWTSAGN